MPQKKNKVVDEAQLNKKGTVSNCYEDGSIGNFARFSGLHYIRKLLRQEIKVSTFSQNVVSNFNGSTVSFYYLQFCTHKCTLTSLTTFVYYGGHLESKERLRIQPAQLFNFS